jgi:UDP-glucose 4-epimerase
LADPHLDADINVLGTINVLEAGRRSGAERIVLAGSAATYGAGVKLPARETFARRPHSPYGASKKAIEDYARVYTKQHGLTSVVLTPANVYGPRQDSSGEGGVVAIFAASLAAGRQPTIFGDGSATRDFVFVDDVADAFLRAASRGTGRNLNVSSGVETTILELYETMARFSRFRRAPRFAAPRDGDIHRSVLDPSAAMRHLGWKAWTPLDDGLAGTQEWFASR